MKNLPPELEKYWRVIEDQICVKCVDGDGEGNCRLPADGTCELQEYFPTIVGLVNNVYSTKIDEYIAKLRLEVCAQCKNLQPNDRCHRREDVDCALDRYYPLVISAIEAVRRQEMEGSHLPLSDESLPPIVGGEYE